jgi:hypothetical protein
MLAAAGWPGDELWLTEGGLNLGSNWGNPAARDAQAAEIEKNFEAMRSLPEVALWVQHGINDVAGNNFKSGLRDDFNTALPGPGTERPAWSTWLSLDGTRPIPPPAATASTAADEPTQQPPPTDTTVPAPTPAPSAPSVNPTTPTGSTTPASEPPATAAAAPVAGPPPIIAPISIADVAPLVESPLMPLPACAISAPRHLDRIHVGRRGTVTLPRTALTARQTACRATVTLTARHQRATKTLTVDRGSSQPITIKPERIDLPAQATIRLVVQSPTPQALSWRAHLVR